MKISDISSRYSPHGSGYIKVYRKLLTSAVFENEKLLKIWIWCLIRANWFEAPCMFEGKELQLDRGMFITGRYTGAEQCNMNPSTFWKCIKKLEEIGNLTLKSDNKKTLVTIVNYSDYQDDILSEYQQSNNKVTTKEQQSNTDKEVKNIRSKEEEYVIPILEKWNRIAEKYKLSTVIKISKKREIAITARLRESEFNLDSIENEIILSDFLRGKNNTGWKVDFDFVSCSANNYLKILEGKYRNGTPTSNNPNSAISRATFKHDDEAKQRLRNLKETLDQRDRERGIGT